MSSNWQGELDFSIDVFQSVLGGGVPAGYHMATSAHEGDWEEFRYYAAVEGTALAMYSIAVLGTPGASFRSIHHVTPLKMQAVKHVASKAALPVAVAAGVVGTSIVYEQQVNEPIRKGSSGTWYGPFASGFGSVV